MPRRKRETTGAVPLVTVPLVPRDAAPPKHNRYTASEGRTPEDAHRLTVAFTPSEWRRMEAFMSRHGIRYATTLVRARLEDVIGD